MEFIGWSIAGPPGPVLADASWSYAEVRLPIALQSDLALLIHSMHLEVGHAFDGTEAAPGEYRRIAALSTWKPAAGQIPERYEQGVIGFVNHALILNTASGTNTMLMVRPPIEYKEFDPPILVATDTLYVACENRGLLDTTASFSGRIGYTLQKVDRETILRALIPHAI